MTNDKTVTMSRELAERLDSPHSSVRNAAIESLRRILAAPVVDRQEVFGFWRVPIGFPLQGMFVRWNEESAQHIANASDVFDFHMLYTSPPAPVAVIVDETQAFADWMHQVVAEVKHNGGVNKIQRKDMMSLAEEKSAHDAWQARACLDKVKEMNR